MTGLRLLIWLVVAVYAGYLFLVLTYPAQAYGPSRLVLRLRRQWADTLLLAGGVGVGIYGALTNQHYLPLLLPLVIFALLLVVAMLHVPRWHLKQTGFIYLFRLVPYQEIADMQLSERGVLTIILRSGGKAELAFANIAELERAAAFFASEEYVQQMLASEAQSR